MDRDRSRDRRRDVPPEDRYGTGRGQSYRPGGARERTPPPPRADSYRARTPPRSPPRRVDSYRGRARSPLRREDLPRDDLFRGRYDDDYPPSRRQSPPRRRYSPEPRERRTPPRAVTRDYRRRSRSPMARNERPDPREVDNWRRPRSPSPQRYLRQDYLSADDNGGRDSTATSRRSSPLVHPSRLALRQPPEDRSARPIPRDSYDSREPYRAYSPEPQRPASPPPRRPSPPPPRRPVSPPPRERRYSDGQDYATNDDRIPPPREPYRADDAPAPRAPPTGPSGQRGPASTMAPPTGPSAAAVPISAHARAPPVPPSGPRAAGPARGDFGAPRGRGGYRGDFGGRGGFGGPPFRGGRGGAPSNPGYGRGGGPSGPGGSFNRSESFDREPDYDRTPSAPPSGPRGTSSQAAPAPPFRPSSNITATTYPRTQRFGPGGQPMPESTTPTGPRGSRRPTEASIERSGPHPAIADLPKPIEGGQKIDPLVDRTRLDKLQEEAEKLRKAIEERETKKRKSLREWDRLSRETEAAGLRSQLAEESLRKLTGEAESAAAF